LGGERRYATFERARSVGQQQQQRAFSAAVLPVVERRIMMAS
jgi:hypothetical protein